MAFNEPETNLNTDMLDKVNPFTNKAVPGQSLTRNPDESPPWERPPEFTRVKPALDTLVEEMLDPDRFVALIQVLASKKLSIATLAQIMLDEGFRAGRWNPDLMMLLAEPLMIILMAISERAEIRDYEIYEGENEELDDDEKMQVAKEVHTGLNEHLTFRGMEMPEPKVSSVPSELLEKIKEAPIEQKSLLEQ